MSPDSQARISALATLFSEPLSDRDAAWRMRMDAIFWTTDLRVGEPQASYGPDGFPYFRLFFPEPNVPFGPEQPTQLVDYLVEHALGLVLLADESTPHWAFTHGDVLAYKLYGTAFPRRFWDEPAKVGEEVLQDFEEALVGAPNEEMFPSLVRSALRGFMRTSLGIPVPKVCLLKRRGHGSRLVFDLDPRDLGGDAGVQGAFNALHWFIPSCIPIYHVPSMSGSSEMVPF